MDVPGQESSGLIDSSCMTHLTSPLPIIGRLIDRSRPIGDFPYADTLFPNTTETMCARW